MSDLLEKKCKPCEGKVPPLTTEQVNELLPHVLGWSLNAAGDAITRRFEFNNYYRTMAFVNAVAWIAHQEGHHPDLEVHYAECHVTYTTHAIKGLTENDFICAAKIQRLAP